MPTLTAERPASRPQSFAERCIASIDAKLAEMPEADRLPALRRSKVKFLAMEEQFKFRVDSGLEPEFAESAFDYPTLLADIETRIAREVRHG